MCFLPIFPNNPDFQEVLTCGPTCQCSLLPHWVQSIQLLKSLQLDFVCGFVTPAAAMQSLQSRNLDMGRLARVPKPRASWRQ